MSEQPKVSHKPVFIWYYNATRPLPEGAKVAERIAPPPDPKRQETKAEPPAKSQEKAAQE